jgi:hypothetical protein
MRKNVHNCTLSLAATIAAWKLPVVRLAMSAAIATAIVSGFNPTPAAAGQKETNRGLSSQEVGRRTLEERTDRLETRSRTKKTKRGVTAVGGYRLR